MNDGSTDPMSLDYASSSDDYDWQAEGAKEVAHSFPNDFGLYDMIGNLGNLPMIGMIMVIQTDGLFGRGPL